ncbi:MAG TPA: hypothetical protein VKR06_01110 [Ktedonosporobacter sp.]|nr:hypothetical protein [Ktedonosporobacter sp.]
MKTLLISKKMRPDAEIEEDEERSQVEVHQWTDEKGIVCACCPYLDNFSIVELVGGRYPARDGRLSSPESLPFSMSCNTFVRVCLHAVQDNIQLGDSSTCIDEVDPEHPGLKTTRGKMIHMRDNVRGNDVCRSREVFLLYKKREKLFKYSLIAL